MSERLIQELADKLGCTVVEATKLFAKGQVAEAMSNILGIAVFLLFMVAAAIVTWRFCRGPRERMSKETYEGWLVAIWVISVVFGITIGLLAQNNALKLLAPEYSGVRELLYLLRG